MLEVQPFFLNNQVLQVCVDSLHKNLAQINLSNILAELAQTRIQIGNITNSTCSVQFSLSRVHALSHQPGRSTFKCTSPGCDATFATAWNLGRHKLGHLRANLWTYGWKVRNDNIVDFSHELNDKGREWGFTELWGVVFGNFTLDLPCRVYAFFSVHFIIGIGLGAWETFFLCLEVDHNISSKFQQSWHGTRFLHIMDPCLLRPNIGEKIFIFAQELHKQMLKSTPGTL